MGTEFYWFYDLLLAGIVLGFTFRCFKRGFVSSLIGLLTLLLSFAVAFIFSDKVSDIIYESFVERRASEYITENLDSITGKNVFAHFAQIQTENIKVDGEKASELEIEFDPAGKTMLELKNVDFSGTGLEHIELPVLGIDPSVTDLKNVDLGKIVISTDDLKKYEIYDLIFAKSLIKLYNETADNSTMAIVGTMLDKVNEYLPSLDDGGSNMIVYAIIELVNSGSDQMTDAIMDGIVKPALIAPINMIVFSLLFLLSHLILGRIAKSLRIVNRIPIVGGINSLLGAAIGVVEAVLVIFVVVIMLHIITSIAGNTIVFLNEPTINNSILFKYIYNSNFLDFTV